MQLFETIQEITHRHGRKLRYVLLIASCVALALSWIFGGLTIPYDPKTLPSMPDSLGTALLAFLLLYGVGEGLKSKRRVGALALLFTGLISLIAALYFSLQAPSPQDTWPYHWFMDPEVALAIIVSIRAKLQDKNDTVFILLSRQAMVIVIAGFGLFSTLTGLSAQLESHGWQPTPGINLYIAAILLLSGALDFIDASQRANAKIVALATPLPAIAYFIFSDMFAHLQSGEGAHIAVDALFIGVLIFGASSITKGVDVFLTTVKESETRNTTLERQSAVIQDLVYALAHDLRSPARGIVQTTDWLREDLADKAYDKIGSRADLLADRAETLYERLDAFVAYVDLCHYVPRRTNVAISPIIERLVSALPTNAVDAVALQGANVSIHTDENALASIISTLMENALGRADPSTPNVVVAWAMDQEGLVLTVEDNGSRLSHAAQSRIFQPFRSSGTAETQNDLSMAYAGRLVDALGGKISVRPNPTTSGMQFRCLFPNMEEENAAEKKALRKPEGQ
ncbi:sensor histidine kinase [Donghicola sp. XS_ASV15]|uniref:sensor histidine kinase n=1 Tax=Donghicola sp. XS_ASV15 TaxID=3241295 RepID=UPI0035125813